MASGSQNMTTYLSKQVIGSNSAQNPAGALLQSGAGRADNSTTGDTWIFLDTIGGTANPWGIKHSQGDNKIKFIGAGTEGGWIRMNTGDTYILGKVGINYNPETSKNTHKLYVNGTSNFTGRIYGTTGNGLEIQSNNTGNWKEGIRVYNASNNYSVVCLCNNDISDLLALVHNGSTHAYYFDIKNAGTYTTINIPSKHSGTMALTDGYGASGSWGISVTGSSASCTGNAATATKATQDQNGYNLNDNYGKEYIQVIDLTSQNTSTWYPVTIPLPFNGMRRVGVISQLNSGSVPSWSSHTSGYTANVEVLTQASGWGTTSMWSILLLDQQGYLKSDEARPVGYSQFTNSSRATFWCRGGAKYRMRSDFFGTWTVYTTATTVSSQSIGPTTTYPGITTTIKLLDASGHAHFSTIYGTLNGNCTGSSGSCTGNAATATNADKVDNYHAADLWRKDGGTWNGNANIACTPTANGQEYSFDLGNAYTGTYWHVWSGKNSKSILMCYNDNMNVSVPNGTLTAKAFSGPLTGNVTGNCSGSSGSCTGNAANVTGTVALAHGGTGGTSANDAIKNLALGVTEASGDFTDSTVMITNSNDGTTSNWYRRSAVKMYNYIKTKASGSWGISVTGSSGSCTGNAASATKLQTARNLWGNSFNGTAAIDGSITMGSAKAIKFVASAGDTATSTPTALTYGRLQAYGTLCINANTDNSGTEYVILTAGKGMSSSGADGLEIGSTTLKFLGTDVVRNSGTWSINVTGSAGSVAWGNVTSKPGNYPGGCTGNAATATSAGKWTTARTLTIGNKGQSVDGSGNVSWALQDILIRSSNEFNFVANAGISAIHFNHKSQSGSNTTTATTAYYFKNGQGATTGVTIYAAAFNGNLTGNVTGNCSGSSGSCTGNAATATKLGTANKGSSNHPIYLSGGTPTECAYPKSGAWWTAVPFIHSDGMMEIGRYIDFHGTSNMTGDHTIRFTCATNTARIDCNGIFAATGWSDLAEYRRTVEHEPGRAVIPTDCGIARRATGRLQSGARIVSDTYGFCLGESDDEQSPIALTGRVLAYPCRPISEYHAGDAVCSGPNGTVDLMTREEIQKYPDCIIGIVNEIPTYPIWNPKHTDDRQKLVFNENVEVRGRIWIDVK